MFAVKIDDPHDPRAQVRRTVVLTKLEAALVEPDLEKLGLQSLQALRDEVAARLRPPREKQENLFGR